MEKEIQHKDTLQDTLKEIETSIKRIEDRFKTIEGYLFLKD